MELRRGNVVLLKRPLADFICVVQWVEGEKVGVRYLDSPRESGYNVVSRDEVLLLAPEQERELPTQFQEALARQRELIFTRKKSKEREMAEAIQELGEEVLDQILTMIEEERR